jgi:hypothetical protein
VKRDGLTPISVATHLEIEWRARDIHPWDRDLLSVSERTATFVDQALHDTEAAICRLFTMLPPLEVFKVRVRDRTSDNVILSGSVSRPDFLARDRTPAHRNAAPVYGVMHHFEASLLEPLEVRL